jgi:hypothetical protein
MQKLCGCVVKTTRILNIMPCCIYILFFFFLYSLTKDPHYRPTPSRMLQHPFILKWENVQIDIGEWIKEVWGWQ